MSDDPVARALSEALEKITSSVPVEILETQMLMSLSYYARRLDLPIASAYLRLGKLLAEREDPDVESAA